MFNKLSSILDYPSPGLDPQVWNKDGKLLPEHKDIILKTLYNLFEENNLKQYVEWASYPNIVGSITTYQYASNADLDIHVAVDFDKFRELENTDLTDVELKDYLDKIRRPINKKNILLPGTQHAIEYFFETELSRQELSPRTGAYDLETNEWLVPPVAINKDFDIEEVQPVMVDIANTLMEELDVSFGHVERKVQRIEELQDVINKWSTEEQATFRNKMERKLQELEDEIKLLEQKRTKVVEDRRNYDPEGQSEINLKFLQRFGYMSILAQLRELLEDDNKITIDELPEVKMILDQANTKPEVRMIFGEDSWPGKDRLIIDFDNTIADNSKVDFPDIGEPFDGVKEALEELKEKGWILNIFSARSNDDGGTKKIKEFMEEHDIPYNEILEGKPHAEYYIDDRAVEFSDWKQVLKDVSSRTKKSDFMPSISIHPPKKDWGPYDVEIPVDPDPSAKEETYYAPWADKPRKRDWLKTLLKFFRSPKEDEEEEITDVKSFFRSADPKKTYKPKTHWDEERLHKPKQDLEPFNPLPTTFQKDINEENLNWRHPFKFMRRPRGPNYANTGDIMDILLSDYDEVEKEASIDAEYWISPKGEKFDVEGGHYEWVAENLGTFELPSSYFNTEEPEAGWDKEDTQTLDSIMVEMFEQGWVRIGSANMGQRGTLQFFIELADARQIPEYIEDFVFSNLDGSSNPIEISDKTGNFIQVIPPFTTFQKAVNLALQQKRMQVAKKNVSTYTDKEAGSVINIPNAVGLDARVYKNPSKQVVINLLDKAEYGDVRYVSFPDGSLYVWTDKDLLHEQVIKGLGYEDNWEAIYNDGAGIINDKNDLDVFDSVYYAASNEPKDLDKKASTYTDQEMEKYYTEQHEIADDPNQGGGFTPRDWNHSTTDFPKPEDLERYKVRLDQLMKPIYRQNPFHIPSYEITYFFSTPSGAYHGDY